MNRYLIVLILLLNYFLFGMLLNSTGILILQSINSFGVTKENAALLEGFKDFSIAIMSFFVGALLPRFGLYKAMGTGLIVVLLACLAMPLIREFWAGKLFFVCVGASFSLIKVSVYTSIGLLCLNRKKHAIMVNIIEGIFMCGVLSGYWIFAAFIDTENPSSLSWLNTYWLLAVLCGVNLIFMTLVRFDGINLSDAALAKNKSPKVFDDFLLMLKLTSHPLVLVFVTSLFLYVLIEQSIGSWLPTFNNQVLKLPANISIQITSIFAFSLALGRLCAGILLYRINWYWLLNSCVCVMVLLVLLTLPLSREIEPNPSSNLLNLPVAAYVFPLIGLFMAPIYPSLSSAILSSIPTAQHSFMTGLIIVFSALGGTTGSVLTGVLFSHFSGQTAFYMTLLPMAIMLLLFHRLRRQTVD